MKEFYTPPTDTDVVVDPEKYLKLKEEYGGNFFKFYDRWDKIEREREETFKKNVGSAMKKLGIERMYKLYHYDELRDTLKAQGLDIRETTWITRYDSEEKERIVEQQGLYLRQAILEARKQPGANREKAEYVGMAIVDALFSEDYADEFIKQIYYNLANAQMREFSYYGTFGHIAYFNINLPRRASQAINDSPLPAITIHQVQKELIDDVIRKNKVLGGILPGVLYMDDNNDARMPIVMPFEGSTLYSRQTPPQN